MRALHLTIGPALLVLGFVVFELIIFCCVGEDENVEKKKMDEEFEEWKSKKFALTVPLNVVALRDSIPPSWIKVCLSSRSFFNFPWLAGRTSLSHYKQK